MDIADFQQAVAAYTQLTPESNLARRAQVFWKIMTPLFSFPEIDAIARQERDYLRRRYPNLRTLGSKISAAGYYKFSHPILLSPDHNAEWVEREDGTRRLQHRALRWVGLQANEWNTYNQDGRTLQRLQDPRSLAPQPFLTRATSLLDSKDWAELAIALIALTGRRPHEILARAQFEPMLDYPYHTLFWGQGKKRGRSVSFAIATLAPATVVCAALERLRKQSYVRKLLREVRQHHLTLTTQNTEIDQRTNRHLNRRVREAFGDVLPPRSGETFDNCKALRAAYAAIAVKRDYSEGTPAEQMLYAARLLGHFVVDGESLPSDAQLVHLVTTLGYGDYRVVGSVPQTPVPAAAALSQGAIALPNSTPSVLSSNVDQDGDRDGDRDGGRNGADHLNRINRTDLIQQTESSVGNPQDSEPVTILDSGAANLDAVDLEGAALEVAHLTTGIQSTNLANDETAPSVPSKATQSKATQSKATQSKATQSKATQSKTTQSKTTQSKADQTKADQTKATRPQVLRSASTELATESKTTFSKTTPAKTTSSKTASSKTVRSKPNSANAAAKTSGTASAAKAKSTPVTRTKAKSAKAPESKVPESKVPESKVPESKVPESKVPESKVPESKTSVSQTTASKTNSTKAATPKGTTSKSKSVKTTTGSKKTNTPVANAQTARVKKTEITTRKAPGKATRKATGNTTKAKASKAKTAATFQAGSQSDRPLQRSRSLRPTINRAVRLAPDDWQCFEALKTTWNLSVGETFHRILSLAQQAMDQSVAPDALVPDAAAPDAVSGDSAVTNTVVTQRVAPLATSETTAHGITAHGITANGAMHGTIIPAAADGIAVASDRQAPAIASPDARVAMLEAKLDALIATLAPQLTPMDLERMDLERMDLGQMDLGQMDLERGHRDRYNHHSSNAMSSPDGANSRPTPLAVAPSGVATIAAPSAAAPSAERTGPISAANVPPWRGMASPAELAVRSRRHPQPQRDWSQIPRTELFGEGGTKPARGAGAVEERLARAAEAIMRWNDQFAPDAAIAEKWAINGRALRDLTGANGQKVADWLAAQTDWIGAHHTRHHIEDVYHNRRYHTAKGDGENQVSELVRSQVYPLIR